MSTGNPRHSAVKLEREIVEIDAALAARRFCAKIVDSAFDASPLASSGTPSRAFRGDGDGVCADGAAVA